MINIEKTKATQNEKPNVTEKGLNLGSTQDKTMTIKDNKITIELTKDIWQTIDLNIKNTFSEELIDQIADRVIEKMKVAQDEQLEIVKRMIDETFRLRAVALRKI